MQNLVQFIIKFKINSPNFQDQSWFILFL